MARTVQLSELRDRARLYADQRSDSTASAFITDSELTQLVNDKLCEHHELLMNAAGDEFAGAISDDTISIVGGTSLYNLPSDFLRLLDVTLEWDSSTHEPVQHLSHHRDRYQWAGATWTRGAPKAFRLRGSQVEFFPNPTSSVTARLQYVPSFTELVNDADTYDGINGWEKLVTLGVAIEMRAIEERPAGELQRLYDQQLKRVTDLAAERQTADPLQIRDVFPEVGGPGRGWPWLA